MDNTCTQDELQHHGIKGQRWGIRRFQTKDGALTKAGQKRYNKEMDKLKAEKKKLRNEERTKKKLAKLDEMKSDVEKMKKGADDDKPVETPEQKRERLLKSTNPKELYENRDLLSTFELNERINRIDTEARLQGKIVEDKKQTGMDYVNDKMQSTKRTLDNATNLYKSIDNAYNSVANSAIGKTLAKQLGLEPPKKEFNLDDFWKNRNKKTTQEIMDVNKRLMAEDSIRKRKEDRDKEAADAEARKQAKKQVDDYNKNWYENDNRSSTYSMKGNGIKDSKVGTGNRNQNSIPLLENVERYTASGKDIVGKGTSKFSGWNNPPSRDAVWDGQRYVDQLLQLEDKRMKHSDDQIESLVADMLESDNDIQHYGIKGMKWGVHRFYNKDGSRTAAGKKRENEAKRGKNQNGDDYDGDPEARPELYYKSSKSSFTEALNDYVPSKNRYGFVNDLEISKDIGNNKNVSVSVRSSAKDSNVNFASSDEMKSRTKKADDFIKQFNDEDMRNYLANSYQEYALEPVSREQFKKSFELVNIRIDPDWNTYEATYLDNGVMNDHIFTIEGDMKTRKPIRSSMDG